MMSLIFSLLELSLSSLCIPLLSMHCNEYCSDLIIQLLISQSGLGVDNTTFINTLLIEECTSVITTQSLFMLASLPAGKCLINIMYT